MLKSLDGFLVNGSARCLLFVAANVLVGAVAYAEPPVLQNDRAAARLYELETREAQFQSLAAIPHADVEYSNFGRLRRLEGHTGILIPEVLSAKRGDSADVVLRKLKPMLLASGAEQLKIRHVGGDGYGGYYIFTDQEIDGIPVIEAGLNLQTTSLGEVRAVTSRFIPNGKVSRAAILPLEEAKHRLGEMLVAAGLATAPSLKISADGAQAYWTDEGRAESPQLVWLIRAQFTTPEGEEDIVEFGVDAATGEVRYSERQEFGLNRTAYSLGYRTSTLDVNHWPQQLTFLFPEASPSSSDVHAYDAWRFASAPVFAWRETGLGLQYETLNVVAHHPVLEAAYFLGSYYEPYLVFGDKYARNMDAVAHEYGHGIFVGWAPPMPSALKWWDEYFAGNEFFADMSAIFTDYYRTHSTDWYVADVRNLQNPIATGGLNWYPEKSNLGTTSAVAYQNSTIYSYAMYLLIHGGYHHRAGQTSIVGLVTIPHILVTAQPVNAVKAVLLGAIYDLKFNNAKFTAPNLKAMMVARAYNVYGPTMAQEVGDAWTAVGVGYNCSGPPPVPQYQIWPGYCKGRHTITWTAQPGVKYHGEIRPVHLGWDYGGITSLDGVVSQCKVNPSGPAMYHMRACNGCGCSNWSYESDLEYWNICQ